MVKPFLLREIPSERGGGKRGVYRCACGVIYETRKYDVDHGKSTNCGCVRKKKVKQRRFIHGESHTKMYYVWSEMINRCHNKNNKNYHQYGRRSIHVCDEWRNNYANFSKWAKSNGYKENLTLDRKNNNLGYSPENCQWVSWKEQQNNKRNNRKFIVDGKEYSIAELAKKAGLSYSTIYSRLCSRKPSKIIWTAKKASETPKLTTSARNRLY